MDVGPYAYVRDQNHCQLKLSGMGDGDMAGLYNPLELTIHNAANLAILSY